MNRSVATLFVFAAVGLAFPASASTWGIRVINANQQGTSYNDLSVDDSGRVFIVYHDGSSGSYSAPANLNARSTPWPRISRGSKTT